MSKTYILWIPHIIMHIETHYSRSFTDAEELFVQSFPILSKVTPNAHNLNMENIIIHNKTRDMPPSISSTILHVRYSEHTDSKSVQSSPIWRYSGSKPHWVIDWLRPGYAYIYIYHWGVSSLVQIMAYHQADTKALPEPMLTYWDLKMKFQINLNENKTNISKHIFGSVIC